MRLGVRSRANGRRIQGPEPAAMRKRLSAPGLKQYLFGLVEARLRFVDVDAVTVIFVDVVSGTAPHADDQSTFAEIVDQRHLLGKPDRMHKRHLRDRKADL